MRQNEVLQNRLHKGISAVFKKTVDPKLKSAMQRELRSKDFVFAENQKEYSDSHTQNGERKVVAVFGLAY